MNSTRTQKIQTQDKRRTRLLPTKSSTIFPVLYILLQIWYSSHIFPKIWINSTGILQFIAQEPFRYLFQINLILVLQNFFLHRNFLSVPLLFLNFPITYFIQVFGRVRFWFLYLEKLNVFIFQICSSSCLEILCVCTNFPNVFLYILILWLVSFFKDLYLGFKSFVPPSILFIKFNTFLSRRFLSLLPLHFVHMFNIHTHK